jgi:hypothetical protein
MTLLDLLTSWLEPAVTGNPRCAQCGRPVSGTYLKALGRHWHPGHFCCGICRAPLGEKFLVSFHQEPFCTEHGTSSLCEACGHLASGGPCRACAAEVLTDPREAAALMVQVQGFLRAEGLPWWPQTFPVRLVGPEELGVSGLRTGSDRVGEITKHTRTGPNGKPIREVPEIRILRGRPKILQGMVLAHELGHAWIFQKGPAGLPRELEEGFCEYCSHLWLSRSQDPRAPYLLDRIARNEDPVYGDGFREVQRRVLASGSPFFHVIAGS